MANYHRRHGQPAKLQPKFMEPYLVVEPLPNHIYNIESSGHGYLK